MPETRTFALADILSVTTGRLLSRRRMDGIYDILGYMTGDNLMTHQLPRAQDACQGPLLAQFPQLDGVMPPDGLDVPELMAWLTKTEREYGEHLSVTPIANWEHRNPIEELCDMVGADKVYVVPVPGE